MDLFKPNPLKSFSDFRALFSTYISMGPLTAYKVCSACKGSKSLKDDIKLKESHQAGFDCGVSNSAKRSHEAKCVTILGGCKTKKSGLGGV